ncbi:protein SOB FIVE-LIKE 1-like [Salvia divinorum]|uniref:Protein SOB FIVE-LIKE 1-like n=1 Tax=Salvia divinorum TaxID=28513 RepID=A0ABD1H449_SALDI
MNPSKFPQGSNQFSSSESGWTAYIGSPHNEDGDDDDRERSKDGEKHKERDADSDDSMASDASSAPSDQFGHYNKHLGYGYGKSTGERKHGGKKEQKQGNVKQHAEKIKAAKGKADCATRSKKK